MVKQMEFWGKTNRDPENPKYLPLLCHMLDVAAVAGVMWDNCLDKSIKERIALSLGEDVRGKVLFLAGIHDIGKACPGFQKRVPELQNMCGLPFSTNDQSKPHGFITAKVLNDLFPNCAATFVLARIAGGHHGIIPRSIDFQMGRDSLGNNDWQTARNALLQEYADTVGLDLNDGFSAIGDIDDPFLVPLLTGFVSVADWIGSNQDFFPCTLKYDVQANTNTEEYWTNAPSRAKNALDNLGWLPAINYAKETGFESVFSNLIPNNLQKTVIKCAASQNSPYLMIIEAPMGQGKSEAAFYAADVAMCRGFARGMYVAMPTQATSNAMFKRVLDDYLGKRGHKGKLNLQLIHGDAMLSQISEVKEGEIQEFNSISIGEGTDMEAQSWFTAKKRPLLAPFGVGTIDQSLLSVLQTRHWFVRLLGLSSKVLVFDEVHAYDAYMSTILERLLCWLAEVDCTVIMLSATLPDTKRKALVKAYSGKEDAEYKRYPRLSLAKPRHWSDTHHDSMPECAEIPMEPSHTMDIGFMQSDLAPLTDNLCRGLVNGGCAAVICNTVGRSIEVYKHLRDNLEDTECLLFHARTLQMWRREREEEVLRKFGKGVRQDDGSYINEHRPHRAVLVATQVIEQSLDLDFDLMASEIAPMDLLLQRAGRLHRHERPRPKDLNNPRIIILCDSKRNGPPPVTFGKSIECLYDRYILLKTWHVLREKDVLHIPKEIEELVESVYGDEPCAWDGCWNDALSKAFKDSEGERIASQNNASRLLVCEPKCPSDLIEEFNNQLLDDDDPEVHKSVKAATREGDASITVVALPHDYVLSDEPNIAEVRYLLDRSVKLSHRGIFQLLLDSGETPDEWRTNAHLRYARLLRLNGQNQGRIGDYLLTVDDTLGVVIEKKGETNV